MMMMMIKSDGDKRLYHRWTVELFTCDFTMSTSQIYRRVFCRLMFNSKHRSMCTAWLTVIGITCYEYVPPQLSFQQ